MPLGIISCLVSVVKWSETSLHVYVSPPTVQWIKTWILSVWIYDSVNVPYHTFSFMGNGFGLFTVYIMVLLRFLLVLFLCKLFQFLLVTFYDAFPFNLEVFSHSN